ncbi:hypothetical protein AAH820_003295 [Yersinia enterocolitica]
MHIKVKQHDKYEIREVLEDNGTNFNIYKYKGKVLPRILLTGILVEQYKAYVFLEKDLRSVIFWIERIKEFSDGINFEGPVFRGGNRNEMNVIKGLYIAVLTTYGRCFTSSKGRSFTLQRGHVPEDCRDIHDNIMHARHNFAAHKGEFSFESCKIALVINKQKKKHELELFSELNQPDIYFESGDDKDWIILHMVNVLRDLMLDKILVIREKIIKECIYPKGANFWLDLNNKTVKI